MDSKRLKQYLLLVVKKTINAAEDGSDPHEALPTIMQSLDAELASHVRSNKTLCSRLAEELNKAWFKSKYYQAEGVRNVKFKPFTASEIYKKPTRNMKMEKEAAELDALGRELRNAVAADPIEDMELRPRLSKSFMFMKRASARRKAADRLEYAQHLQKKAAAQEEKRARIVINKLASQYQEALDKREEAFNDLLAATGVNELKALVKEFAPDMQFPIRKVASAVQKRVSKTAKQQMIEDFKEASEEVMQIKEAMEHALNQSPRILSKLLTISGGN